MKKLPTGVSNYEKLIEENYYYIDKTMYIEKLENYANPSFKVSSPKKIWKKLIYEYT